MARPKKNPALVESKRFTMRMTEHNWEHLKWLSKKENKPMAEVILEALQMYTDAKR